MNVEIQTYNDSQNTVEKEICNLLATLIDGELSEAKGKIWHAHPVWFLDGNPIVGYSKLKDRVQLLFWSGQGFEEEKLQKQGKFKAAAFCYSSREQVDLLDVKKVAKKARAIQWDYKNIVNRKGQLERLK